MHRSSAWIINNELPSPIHTLCLCVYISIYMYTCVSTFRNRIFLSRVLVLLNWKAALYMPLNHSLYWPCTFISAELAIIDFLFILPAYAANTICCCVYGSLLCARVCIMKKASCRRYSMYSFSQEASKAPHCSSLRRRFFIFSLSLSSAFFVLGSAVYFRIIIATLFLSFSSASWRFNSRD